MGEILYALNDATGELIELGKAKEFDRVPDGCRIIGEYSDEYAKLKKDTNKSLWVNICPECGGSEGMYVGSNGHDGREGMEHPWECHDCGCIYDMMGCGELRQYDGKFYTVVKKESEHIKGPEKDLYKEEKEKLEKEE